MSYYHLLNFNTYEALEPVVSISELDKESDVMIEAMNLLKERSHWHKNRLALVGKNCNTSPINLSTIAAFKSSCPAYVQTIFENDKDSELFLNSACLIAPQRRSYGGDDVRYIFNHSSKKYIDTHNMSKYELSIHPLAVLLLVDGENHGINGDIGKWAGDLLSTSDIMLYKYEKMDLGFTLLKKSNI